MKKQLALIFFIAILAIIKTDEPFKLPVLTYHSVMPYNTYEDNPYILSEEVFYKHMQYLYDNGFNTITIEQFLNFFLYNIELPRNPILLTFDDGYLDNVLFVYPILNQFGFTAISFLLTGALSIEDPIQFMSIDEIYATNDIFEFASHTHDMHSYPVSVESVENIRFDLRLSFEFPLSSTQVFAYPFGIYNDNIIEALIAEDVLVAFTGGRRYVTRNSNPFKLPRFSVVSNWDMELFSAIVNGRHTSILHYLFHIRTNDKLIKIFTAILIIGIHALVFISYKNE